MTLLLPLILSFSVALSIALFQNVSLNQNGRKTESVIATKVLSVALTPAPPGTYDENGCPMMEDQSWVGGWAIGCETSPDGRLLGKFIYNGFSFPDRYYELFIKTLFGNGIERRIYAGDFRTLGWEWLNDEQIVVIYNCGSGCQATRVTGIDESISISDYGEGEINKENGWEVKFFNTF